MEEVDKFEIPVTKVQWGLRGAQAFFALIAMFTISAVIGWDNKYFSASLFSVFFLFIILVSVFFAVAIVGIPHLYITKGKFKDAARALRIPRIEFVLSAIWAVLIFIVTFLLTIDAYVLRKCDPNNPKYDNYTDDPNETFTSGLPKICNTQRAANAFGWFTLTAWLCSLVLIANDWRKNRRPPAPQGPITYHNKPSNLSISSSLEEHGLPDTSTQQTQEHVPMQNIHSTPYPPPQPPQQQQQFSPHPTFPQHQQTFSSPPLAPIPGPPPSSIPMPGPQFTQGPGQGPGQDQGQGQGQSPGQGGISFPQPRYT